MTTTFEIKRKYAITIKEEKLIETIKKAMDDFVPPDDYDCLEDWALDLMLENAFDRAEFIKVNNSSYSFDEILDYFEYDTADYIRNIVVNFIAKWVRENWS